MDNHFYLHSYKSDENIHRWCFKRSFGLSRTILYPHLPGMDCQLQDSSIILEEGELPIYEMMGDYKGEYAYTLITTRYFVVVMGTTFCKYRIEDITLGKSINDVIEDYKKGSYSESHTTNFASTSNGIQFIFITEVGTYQIMLYQIMKDFNFMCEKYRKKHE